LLLASDNPIAMACFRLVTRPPLPPFPLRNVPRFRRRMALSTRLLAACPYRAILASYMYGPHRKWRPGRGQSHPDPPVL